MGIRLTAAAAAVVLVAGSTALTGGPAAAAPEQEAKATPGGSIVFLKDHDVWLVRADGSGLHRVTTDGTRADPYYSPSMSDDGTIAVGNGPFVVRMRQNGTVLNAMDPPPMNNSAGQPTDGPPVNVAISPDGTKIAYTMVNFGCPVAADCLARAVTGVTSSTRLTSPTGRSYQHHPSWVSNGRLMVHGGYLSQVMLQNLGGSTQHWFDDSDVYGDLDGTDLGDASLSRDGDSLVAVRGYGPDSHLIWYDVSGDVAHGSPASLPDPAPLCLTNSDAHVAEPTWSPDGTAFAFADSDGIGLARPGSTCGTTTFARVVDGGSSPFWSPAAVNPGPRTFDRDARPTIKGTPRVGKTLRATKGVWSPAPASASYAWLRNGRPIKGAKQRSYVLKRGDRGKRISVRVTVRKPGFRAAKATSVARRVR